MTASPSISHKMDVRVYYEDTDSGGVVYHANYLKFAERARTELLRSLGFENKSLMDLDEILFVVHRAELDYTQPARLDDLLTVETTFEGIRNSSFTMKQTILRDEAIVCKALIRLVCVNTEGRAVRVPDHLRQAFQTTQKE